MTLRRWARTSLPIIFAIGLLFTGCTHSPTDSPPSTAAQEILSNYDLDGLTSREVVDALDRLPVTERPRDLIASVRANEVLMATAHGDEASLELPSDEFYVSIAPYAEQTHECFYHSLTTCLGELANVDVQVTVTTDAGQVLVQDTMTTFDNGFLGLWLPRDISGTITVTHEGRTVTAPIATDSAAPTCVTTLQLA